MHQVRERYLAEGSDVFSAFTNLEKACDRVHMKALEMVFRLYGVFGNLLKVVQSLSVGSKALLGWKAR